MVLRAGIVFCCDDDSFDALFVLFFLLDLLDRCCFGLEGPGTLLGVPAAPAAPAATVSLPATSGVSVAGCGVSRGSTVGGERMAAATLPRARLDLDLERDLELVRMPSVSGRLRISSARPGIDGSSSSPPCSSAVAATAGSSSVGGESVDDLDSASDSGWSESTLGSVWGIESSPSEGTLPVEEPETPRFCQRALDELPLPLKPMPMPKPRASSVG
jgi:hypothetical protein